MSQGESKLSRRIMAAIRAGGGYAVKIHGGPFTTAGTPDILACIPVRVVTETLSGGGLLVRPEIKGLFVGLETKMPAGDDPSPIQRLRHEQIRAAGGVVIVPRSVEDAVEALDALGWVRVPVTGDQPLDDESGPV